MIKQKPVASRFVHLTKSDEEQVLSVRRDFGYTDRERTTLSSLLTGIQEFPDTVEVSAELCMENWR